MLQFICSRSCSSFGMSIPVSSNISDEASASVIVKSVNDAFDGSVGGRADFAQGGSSQKESVDEMVTKLKGLFKG